MASFIGTFGSDTANAATSTLIGFTGGSIGELQDAFGDFFAGGTGNDTIIAGSGNDTIQGGENTDSINGGAGNDLIQVLEGQFIDHVDGGSGFDTLDLSPHHKLWRCHQPDPFYVEFVAKLWRACVHWQY